MFARKESSPKESSKSEIITSTTHYLYEAEEYVDYKNIRKDPQSMLKTTQRNEEPHFSKFMLAPIYERRGGRPNYRQKNWSPQN